MLKFVHSFQLDDDFKKVCMLEKIISLPPVNILEQWFMPFQRVVAVQKKCNYGHLYAKEPV